MQADELRHNRRATLVETAILPITGCWPSLALRRGRRVCFAPSSEKEAQPSAASPAAALPPHDADLLATGAAP